MRATIPVAREGLPIPVLLYLICVIVPFGFSLGPLVLSSVRLFLLLMAAPLLLRILQGHLGRIYASDVFFFLHMVWFSLAMIVVSPQQAIEQIGSVGVEFLGGYLLGRVYIRTYDHYLALARFLVVVCIAMLPFAIYETLTGDPILLMLLQSVPGMKTVEVITYETRLGFERVQLMFAHPIHFGLFCSLVLMQAVVASAPGTTFARGRGFFSSVLITLSGALSLSSGPLFSFALQFGFLAWDWILRSVRSRWFWLLGLFALSYVAIDLFSSRTPIRVFMSYATFSAETAYWRSMIFDYGMDNVWAHPVLGLGMGDWARPWYMFTSSVDNFWLLLAMRSGIPALIFLAVGYFWMLLRIMRLKIPASSPLAGVRRAWVFSFTALAFTLTTVHVWSNLYSFVFFLFGAGLWLIHASLDDEQTAPAPSTIRSGPVYSRFEARKRQRDTD